MRNVGNVERPAALGLMEPAGSAAVETAKADGRWKAAYEGPAAAQPAEDFPAALEGNPRALEKLGSLGAAERYAIYCRFHTVKCAETRPGRLAAYLALLDAGQGNL